MYREKYIKYKTKYLRLLNGSGQRGGAAKGPGIPSIFGICTLRNLGNTCFINASLQLLWHIDSLRDYLLNVTDDEIDGLHGLTNAELRVDGRLGSFYTTNNEIEKLGGLGQCFSNGVRGKISDVDRYKNNIKALSALFKTFNNALLADNDAPIDISEIPVGSSGGDSTVYNILSEEIRRTVDNYNQTVEDRTQEDAGEFLVILSSFNCFLNNGKIYEMFKRICLKIRSTLTCEDKRTRSTTELYQILQLPITGGASISELITNFTEKETLIDDERLSGVNNLCAGSKNDTKQLNIEFWDISTTLIIQLKRFSSVFNEDTFTNTSVKNRSKVVPDKNLKINNNTYLIQGCILHRGKSLNDGHFVYIVYDESGNPKTYVSDEETRDIPGKKKSINYINANGYFFLYKKIDELELRQDNASAQSRGRPFEEPGSARGSRGAIKRYEAPTTASTL